MAVADVLASAVDLVMGKTTGVAAPSSGPSTPPWFRDTSVRGNRPPRRRKPFR